MNFGKNIIEIIKSALKIESSIDTNIDWQKLMVYAKKHKIIPLFCHGFSNAGVKVPPEVDETLFSNTAFNMSVSNNQLFELERMKKAFLEEKIDFIVLKGAILKEYYPSPEMRPMGDIDMLIKIDQYDKISAIMKELGFKELPPSNYEFKWSKGQVLVELHKRLTAPTNRDFCRYYGDGWKLAIPVEDTTEYTYSREDYFVYLFMHFTRHYRDAGIGLLHLIDIYLYLEKHNDMDEEYLLRELNELRLAEFFENVKRTVEACFKGGTTDEKTDIILKRIVASGSYGTKSSLIVAVGAKNTQNTKSKKNVRIALFWNRVFMPYKDMCVRHKILRKAPFLLPFFWIYRIFEVLFVNKETLKREIDNLKHSNPEEVYAFKNELKAIGLDYNFDE